MGKIPPVTHTLQQMRCRTIPSIGCHRSIIWYRHMVPSGLVCVPNRNALLIILRASAHHEPRFDLFSAADTQNLSRNGAVRLFATGNGAMRDGLHNWRCIPLLWPPVHIAMSCDPIFVAGDDGTPLFGVGGCKMDVRQITDSIWLLERITKQYGPLLRELEEIYKETRLGMTVNGLLKAVIDATVGKPNLNSPEFRTSPSTSHNGS